MSSSYALTRDLPELDYDAAVDRVTSLLKGPRRNNFAELVPRCAADSACPIERDRRCSPSYIEDLAIEGEPKLRYRWAAKM